MMKCDTTMTLPTMTSLWLTTLVANFLLVPTLVGTVAAFDHPEGGVPVNLRTARVKFRTHENFLSFAIDSHNFEQGLDTLRLT